MRISTVAALMIVATYWLSGCTQDSKHTQVDSEQHASRIWQG